MCFLSFVKISVFNVKNPRKNAETNTRKSDKKCSDKQKIASANIISVEISIFTIIVLVLSLLYSVDIFTSMLYVHQNNV